MPPENSGWKLMHMIVEPNKLVVYSEQKAPTL